MKKLALFLIIISGVFPSVGFHVYAEENLSGSIKKDSDESRFLVFDNEHSEIPYRIPAIAKNREGDLIAVADYRYSKADIGMVEDGKIDLVFRIKDGKTGEWSEIKTLAAAREENGENFAFGDPCIVADSESDRVLVTSCCGNVSFLKGTKENHQGWAIFYSEDGGKTWSDYEDISDQVMNRLDQREGGIRAFFIGSGKITQSRKIKKGDYYRLYCAALVRTNAKEKVNYVFYSDDFGKNWELLGEVEDCPVTKGADEPKTEELPDGSVMISSRISGGRLFNIFKYEDEEFNKGQWGKMAVSNRDVDGVIASTNACNGEVLLVPVRNNKTQKNSFLLLQSVPMSQEGKRAEVGINYKELSGIEDYATPERLASDWTGKYLVTDKNSAYSTMVTDKDNDLAFFYEEDVYNGGFNMIYCKIPIEELTEGIYSYDDSFLP